MFISFIIKFIQAIHANDSPRQMGFGFALGSLLGFLPIASLQGITVLILIYLLNVNIGMAFIAAAIYKVLAALLSIPAHHVGYFLLVDIGYLRDFWTTLYNAAIIPWSKFYNTVIMGSLVFAVILFVPNYFAGKAVVIAYRKHVRDRLAKMKIVQVFRGTFIYDWYRKYRSIRDKF